VLAGALVAGLLAGCAASQPPAGRTPSATARPSSPSAAVAGLRGVAVAAVDCSAVGREPAGTLVTLPPAVRELVVCRPGAGLTAPAAPSVLGPVPAAVLAAFAAADQAAAGGAPQACPMFVTLPQVVFAVLVDRSVYRLWIPLDSCQHYLAAAMGVLTPTPSG
jgi:hypothetical protein